MCRKVKVMISNLPRPNAVSIGTAGSTPRKAVTKRESHLTHKGDPYWLVEPPPAAREQLVEELALNAERHRSRTHFVARAGADGLDGGRVMSMGQHGHVAADTGKGRLRQHPVRGGGVDAVRL